MSCTSQSLFNCPSNTTEAHITAAGGSVPSLYEFLSSCKLSQYHEGFLASGAEEEDVIMLLDFTDEEITELCTAISLKPFHTISFKRGIRMLREKIGLCVPQTMNIKPPSAVHSTTANPPSSSVPSMSTNTTKSTTPLLSISNSYSPERIFRNHSDIPKSPPNVASLEHGTPIHTIGSEALTPSNRELIIERATIYRGKGQRKLTKYETSMNEAAVDIALAEPTLILNRGQLIEKSKAKLLQDGYIYSRGRSRSKLVQEISKPEFQPINSSTSPTLSDLRYRDIESSSTLDKKYHSIISGNMYKRESCESEDSDNPKNKQSKLDTENEEEKHENS
ncbi:hypothetical protein K7432_002732 [Basidiobolus ranarum]|uniref:SAM domain-containing protein n=1 Tax=Basidiobolus ranarum TaxID=34480 RepID=A0ABR2X1A6_9FUNG